MQSQMDGTFTNVIGWSKGTITVECEDMKHCYSDPSLCGVDALIRQTIFRSQ